MAEGEDERVSEGKLLHHLFILKMAIRLDWALGLILFR